MPPAQGSYKFFGNDTKNFGERGWPTVCAWDLFFKTGNCFII